MGRQEGKGEEGGGGRQMKTGKMERGGGTSYMFACRLIWSPALLFGHFPSLAGLSPDSSITVQLQHSNVIRRSTASILSRQSASPCLRHSVTAELV